MLAAKYGQDLINHEKAVKNKSFEMEKKLEGSIFTFWLFTLKPSSCINRNKDSLMGSLARQLTKDITSGNLLHESAGPK